MDDKNKNIKKDEKSFMENAEGFLSSWKDDYGNKNKEILDRKKKRDEQAEKEHKEFLKNLEEVKGDIKEKANKLAEILDKEFEGFKDAFQKGTASVHEKFQLQKHFDDFKFFIEKAERKGVEKFTELTTKVEKDLSEVDTTKLTINPVEVQKAEFESIMQEAESLFDNDKVEKDIEIDEKQNNINKLFEDLNKD